MEARAAHQKATLADLYEPDVMPPNLRKAYATLDRATGRLYRPQGFTTERERVEHIPSRYEKLTAEEKPKPPPAHPRPGDAGWVTPTARPCLITPCGL